MNKIDYLRRRVADEYSKTNYQAAAEMGEVLLREHWHNSNMQTMGYANDLYNLALIYDELGELERAAALYSDSAGQIVQIEGETISFAARLNALAVTLGRMGIDEPAYFMLSHCVDIHRRELGNRDPLYADSLYNLANAAADLGQFKDSLRFHLDALRVREIVGRTPDIINSLHSIAFLYESSQDFENAVSYAETALELSGDYQESQASARNYLASLYENLSKYEKALPLYDSVLETVLDEVGREHSTWMNVAFRRANLLARMKRSQDALICMEEVCRVFESMTEPGTGHIFYANCLRSRALLHMEMKQPHLAETLILDSMKTRRHASDDISIDAILLIRLYLERGQCNEALEVLIYVLMCSDSKGVGFPTFLTSLTDMFTNADGIDTSEFIKAMEVLNDRSRLRPILDKWAAWEKDRSE